MISVGDFKNKRNMTQRMGTFEDVVAMYKVKSQVLVVQNEKQWIHGLTFLYEQLDDDLVNKMLGVSKEELRVQGLEQLVKTRHHVPVAEFYCSFTNDLHMQLLSREQGKSALLNCMAHRLFGYRPDIERNELEHEIATNSDLAADVMVDYLLKLRGPFGARAFTGCLTYMDILGHRILQYSIIMAFLENQIKEMLTAEEPKHKPKEESHDHDGEYDF